MEHLEYHCCIGMESEDSVTYSELLSFIQTVAIYTNCGFEYTPVKGHHIHICIIFDEPYPEYFYKKLTKLRKSLNYVKKQSSTDSALGWYWKPASTKNNLAYILKQETKTKENVEWYKEPNEDIEKYKELSLQTVENHMRNKNNHYNELVTYLSNKEINLNNKCETTNGILSFYTDQLDKLLPTRSQFEQLYQTIQFKENHKHHQVQDYYTLNLI